MSSVQIETTKACAVGFRSNAISARCAWGCLALAVVSEVVGLVAMKVATAHGSIVGHIVLYVLVATSYFLLAKAVQRISVGVAYAIWEGSGIALITLVSWLAFAHALSARELAGLVLAVVGIVLVNAGQIHEPPNKLNSTI